VITQSAPGVIRAEHPDLGVYHLHADGRPAELLFCDNESNNHRLWNQPRTAGFFKDGFNDRVVLGDTTVVNPAQCGTKAAPWYTREVPAAGRIQIHCVCVASSAAQPSRTSTGFSHAGSGKPTSSTHICSGTFLTPMRASFSARPSPG